MFLESNPVPPGAWPEMERKSGNAYAASVPKTGRTNGFFAAARPVYTRKNVFIGVLGGYIPIAEATPEKMRRSAASWIALPRKLTLTGELS